MVTGRFEQHTKGFEPNVSVTDDGFRERETETNSGSIVCYHVAVAAVVAIVAVVGSNHVVVGNADANYSGLDYGFNRYVDYAVVPNNFAVIYADAMDAIVAVSSLKENTSVAYVIRVLTDVETAIVRVQICEAGFAANVKGLSNFCRLTHEVSTNSVKSEELGNLAISEQQADC